MLNLTFDITPTPKQSVRFAEGRAYQTTKIVNTEKVIKILAKKQLPKDFTKFESCPLKAEVVYVFQYNKSLSQKAVQAILEGEQKGEYVRKFTKPDVTDNLNKLLFDSLQGIVYENDSQISDFHATKVYGKADKIILKISQVWERE